MTLAGTTAPELRQASSRMLSYADILWRCAILWSSGNLREKVRVDVVTYDSSTLPERDPPFFRKAPWHIKRLLVYTANLVVL